MKNQTKKIFAKEMEREVALKPISEITVADICKKCGASRQAFYYHFKDKYDLLAWIYMQDFAFSIKQAGNLDRDTLVQMFQRMESRSSFYRNVFSDHSQNNLLDYIQEYDTNFLLKILKEQYHADTTSNELQIAVKYHSYGMTGLIRDWLSGKIRQKAEQLADFLHEDLFDLIKRYIT